MFGPGWHTLTVKHTTDLRGVYFVRFRFRDAASQSYSTVPLSNIDWNHLEEWLSSMEDLRVRFAEAVYVA